MLSKGINVEIMLKTEKYALKQATCFKRKDFFITEYTLNHEWLLKLVKLLLNVISLLKT